MIKDGTAPLSLAHLSKLTSLANFIDEHGYGPTVRGMCLLWDIASTGNVYYYINIWLRRGLITAKRVGGRQRVVGYTVRLTNAGEALVAKYRVEERHASTV